MSSVSIKAYLACYFLSTLLFVPKLTLLNFQEFFIDNNLLENWFF